MLKLKSAQKRPVDDGDDFSPPLELDKSVDAELVDTSDVSPSASTEGTITLEEGTVSKTMSPEELEMVEFLAAKEAEGKTNESEVLSPSAAKKAAQVAETSAATPAPPAPAETAATDPSSPETSTEENKNIEEDEEKNRTILQAFHSLAMAEGLKGEDALKRAKQLMSVARGTAQNGAAEEAQKTQRRAQQQGGGGRGINLGIGAAIGGLGSVFKTTGKGLKVSAGVLGNRIFQHHVSDYENLHKSFNENRDVLAKNLKEADIAFRESIGGQAIAEIARKNSLTFEQVVKNIQDGSDKTPESRVAYHSATHDTEYNNKMRAADEALAKTTELGTQTIAKFDKLNSTYSHRFDSEQLKGTLLNDIEKMDALNKPIAGTADDAEKHKKFQEQLDKFTETMKEMIDRIVQKIVSLVARR